MLLFCASQNNEREQKYRISENKLSFRCCAVSHVCKTRSIFDLFTLRTVSRFGCAGIRDTMKYIRTTSRSSCCVGDDVSGERAPPSSRIIECAELIRS